MSTESGSYNRIGRHVENSPVNPEVVTEAFRNLSTTAAELEPEKFEYTNAAIDPLDFSLLSDILSRDSRKSSENSADTNTITRARILAYPSEAIPGTEMGYSAMANVIVVDVDGERIAHLRGYPDSSMWTPEVKKMQTATFFSFMQGLIHETCHGYGFNSYLYKRTDLLGIPGRVRINEQSGYEVSEKVRDLHSDGSGYTEKRQGALEFWNEGMTDWYSLQVMKEYLDHQSIEWNGIVLTKDNFAELVPVVYMDSPYNLALLTVQTVIDRCADEFGLPAEVVGKAMVRGYMSDSGAQELPALIAEVFNDEFVQKIQQSDLDEASDPAAVKELVKAHVADHPELSEKFKKFLEKGED